MALQELQPRIKISNFELWRRPVRYLREGDVIERAMDGLVEPITAGTYPGIQIVVGANDKVSVIWHEGHEFYNSGQYNKVYTLDGKDIKTDPVVRKLVKYK